MKYHTRPRGVTSGLFLCKKCETCYKGSHPERRLIWIKGDYSSVGVLLLVSVSSVTSSADVSSTITVFPVDGFRRVSRITLPSFSNCFFCVL